MNYYLDTEFHEYKKKVFPWSKGIDTIDLISIGIVSENGREYYVICKDFDLKAAWNSWQIEDTLPDSLAFGKHKEYWIRENVLKPIWIEFHKKELGAKYKMEQLKVVGGYDPCKDNFCYRSLKRLLKKYGKSNAQIAKEVLYFCSNGYFDNTGFDLKEARQYELVNNNKPVFYAYIAASDWVVFYWLFGKLIERPKGFPMYCRDLKQMLDGKAEHLANNITGKNTKKVLKELKDSNKYPKQSNEHNALADAKWNKELHKFIEVIKSI